MYIDGAPVKRSLRSASRLHSCHQHDCCCRYAILDGPAMPIVAEGDEEPNDTYVEQLTSSAKAAIDVRASASSAASCGCRCPPPTCCLLSATWTYVTFCTMGRYETWFSVLQEVVRLGVVDPKRVAVGGHSYGAFMTAGLLANAPVRS